MWRTLICLVLLSLLPGPLEGQARKIESLHVAGRDERYPTARISAGNSASWMKHRVVGDDFRSFVRIYDRPGIPDPKDIAPTPKIIVPIDPPFIPIDPPVTPIGPARNPVPADGSVLTTTWATLSWSPGYASVWYRVYFGDNLEDVSSSADHTFQGSQTGTSFLVGFPGFAFSEGLVPGTTYYWRIDGVLATGAVMRGVVWSFTVLGERAYAPFPANGAESVDADVELSWTAGFGAILHIVYFGDNPDSVDAGADETYRGPTGATSFHPEIHELGRTYYWRVDEFDGFTTHKGEIWSFMVANFIVVDDFESYNDIDPPESASNRIFDKWIAGFGLPFNGSQVGYDMPPYAEQTIVHSGRQSMPLSYVNTGGAANSEAILMLTDPRDWTRHGVRELSIWLQGIASNTGEPVYVALSNADGASAVQYHHDPDAAMVDTWTQWVIDLAHFSDHGIDLANVDSMAIGMGTTGGRSAYGGSGLVFIDDIRLYSRAEREYRFSGAPRDILDGEWTWCHLYIEDAGTIVDMDVELNINHEYGNDLEVAIFPPGMIDLAAGVRLSVRDYSWTDGIDTMFDDEAPPDGWPRHRQPEDSLSVFDGRNVRGEWTLLIADYAAADVGVLQSWSLIVELQ